MRVERWRDIPGYEGLYQVSDRGRVFSTKRKQLLKPLISPNGYCRVRLYGKPSKNELVLVHRLVAAAFVQNTERKPQVNHINGEKTDNRAVNLEWATHSENQRHRFEVLDKRNTGGKPVICTDTGAVFPTATAAAKELKLNRSAVTSCCLGKRKHTNNLHFNFMEE